jgi:hypothetical protein
LSTSPVLNGFEGRGIIIPKHKITDSIMSKLQAKFFTSSSSLFKKDINEVLNEGIYKKVSKKAKAMGVKLHETSDEKTHEMALYSSMLDFDS